MGSFSFALKTVRKTVRKSGSTSALILAEGGSGASARARPTTEHLWPSPLYLARGSVPLIS